MHKRTRMENTVAKKGLVLLVIAFAAFYLLTQPVGAAGAIKGAATAVVEGFESVIQFISALFS